MSCGCAVVCTNIGGHLDYGVDNETALLFEPGNVSDMFSKLEMLLTDNLKRIQIANQGHHLITTVFNWNESIQKIQNCFYSSLHN